MKQWIAACLALSYALGVAAADVPAELAKAVKDYDEAQVHGDRGALERLVADDYTLVNSRGVVQGKADLIADYTAPGYKIEPYVVREPIEKIWSDGAVMGGVATLKGVDGGKPFSVTLRFADIWAKRKGQWQVIYTHVSPPAM
jgi:ketosteroid isomerase-like protein